MEYSEKIITSFKQEANELIEGLNYNLVRLETAPNDEALINEIFRLAHSIKSSSALMGFDQISGIAHKIEDLFILIRNKTMQVDKALVSFLLQGSDLLDQMLEAMVQKKNMDKSTIEAYDEKLSGLLAPFQAPGRTQGSRLQAPLLITEFEKDVVAKEVQNNKKVFHVTLTMAPGVELKYARAYLIYNSIQGLCKIIKTVPDINLQGDDSLFEVFQILLSTDKTEKELRPLLEDNEIAKIDILLWSASPILERTAESQVRTVRIETGIRVEVREVEEIVNLIGELILTKSELLLLKQRIKENLSDNQTYDDLTGSLFRLEDTIDKLRSAFMKVRMVSIQNLFRPLMKYIRDTASSLGKEAELEIYGGETLIDRTMLEALINPLSHLIRNSLSHGIESPMERKKKGKPEKGMIRISASQSGPNIIIEVEDDGAGIDHDKILDLGVRKGLVSKDAVLNTRTLLNLICIPGLTTDTAISDISGRGVGMDVVKTAVEKMQGSLELSTEKDKGSKFRLFLPMSLSLVKTLLVSSGDNVIGIPVNFISRTFLVKAKDLEAGGSAGAGAPYDGDRLEFMDELWAGRPFKRGTDFLQGIEISYQNEKLGLIVDTIINEEELVMKDTDRIFKENRLIAGASLLGDGRIVFIMNVINLFRERNINA